MTERELIVKEINELICALDAPVSDIGDWKISKIYEYRMNGLEDPYDFKELTKKRQEARDRINELQNKLDEIDAARMKEIAAETASNSEA